jgi:hypothetical protein
MSVSVSVSVLELDVNARRYVLDPVYLYILYTLRSFSNILACPYFAFHVGTMTLVEKVFCGTVILSFKN